jgi:CelD/BcsL family acetyltransferase involved in cellulose biosynthesis
MHFYTLDPLLDHRWDDLVASHPQASAFHTAGWLWALAKTFGYRPIVLTSTPPHRRLLDGVVFCEIRSWITGSRLISLPFSDHVEPLLSESGPNQGLEQWVQTVRSLHGWKYVELRPIFPRSEAPSPLKVSQSFWLHRLNLSPSIEQLFSSLHKNCIQRRIRHAEHEHLTYERGAYDGLIRAFYNLLIITRRRFGLLPQPQTWFRNVIAGMSPNAEIRLVRKNDVPIAAIFTLRHHNTVVYKYGCSDHRFHHLGGMPLLFWKLIEESKSEGAAQVDFGRTDIDNRGLTGFKDRLGTTRTKIDYLRYPANKKAGLAPLAQIAAARDLCSILPSPLSSALGRLVYRHVA